MTLYITEKIDSGKIEKDYDLVIVYDNQILYDNIDTKKILIGVDGKILDNNFFEDIKCNELEVLKQLLFRVMMINLNIRKYSSTIGIYGKSKKTIESMFNSNIAPMKHTINNFNKDMLLKGFEEVPKDNYQLYLTTLSTLKGGKFIKIYSEAIEFLWNISSSLFHTFLYNNFIPIDKYIYILDSYIYYFAIDYIKKVDIKHSDLDSDYNFTPKAVKLIFKFFNEKITKLNNNKYDFISIIEDELDSLDKFNKFEI